MADDTRHSIIVGIAEVKQGLVSHYRLTTALSEIEDLWIGAHAAQDSAEYDAFPNFSRRALGKPKEAPKRPPPWYIGLSSSFKKDIDKIDMKVRGRILEAISNITEDP